MDTSTIFSRIQFAFTIGYHFLFPQFTMGLALLLVILKILYLVRKDERYNTAVHFWGKIFAITFVFGVVTGIPMEFQFGTNWALFSSYAGGIIAQTLAMEGAFAFFLESAFLGLFLFGEQTIGQRWHLVTTILVWFGTWLSGWFIIVSNAWMQHPVGYALEHGRLNISNWVAVMTNPWAVPQYFHTISGSVVTAAFMMTGLGAYYLLAGREKDYGRMFVALGVIVGLLASLFQLYPSGDLEGLQVTKYQPTKLAAMEGLFQTQRGAGIVILGQPNVPKGTLDNPIIVPYVLSFLTYRRWTAIVQGLNTFPTDQHPDSVEMLYYSYHIMVGLGTLFIVITALALLLLWRGKLFQSRWMLWVLMLATPFPYIANTAGWFTTELGRQPWIVFGQLRTVYGSSPQLSTGNVIFTLLGFAGMYLLLGLLYVLMVVFLALKGPAASAEEATPEEAGDLGLLGEQE